MKLTDNKFNHSEKDCKPNNITHPKQLKAQSATTGRRKRNPQSKQETVTKYKFTQNKSFE